MELLTYLLKSELVFGLLVFFYVALLRRETFFTANRTYLLGTVLLASLLPLASVAVGVLPPVRVELPVFMYAGTPAHAATGPDRGVLWPLVYVCGVIVHLSWTVVDLLRGRMALRSAAPSGPMAFMGRVAMPGGLHAAEHAAVLAHETTHVRQRHGIDLLFFRLVAALHWYNPLWSWAFRELKRVHEYAADAVARQYVPHYEEIIVARALGVPRLPLVHFFRSSNIKHRLIMLQKGHSTKRAGFKYLLILPLLVVGLSLTAWNTAPVASPVAQADGDPVFPGGQAALFKYLADHIKYPVEAEGQRVEGTVYVGFIVAADGRVTDVAAKRSPDPVLAAEAERVVRSMPRWEPAIKEGVPVASEMVLPIRFALGGGDGK
ncbi:MAG: M56 family metallopeptidase [Flavobacteriales bacterium]|jgi:TonB family protein|nr:M56 family metallopeptidase [Flavobacteriales bacterium]